MDCSLAPVAGLKPCPWSSTSIDQTGLRVVVVASQPNRDRTTTVLHGVEASLDHGDTGGLDACLVHSEGHAQGFDGLCRHQFHVGHHRKVQHHLHDEPTTVAELASASTPASSLLDGKVKTEEECLSSSRDDPAIANAAEYLWIASDLIKQPPACIMAICVPAPGSVI